MDMLVPGIGELVGGSTREEDLDKLDALIAEKGLEKEGTETPPLVQRGEVS